MSFPEHLFPNKTTYVADFANRCAGMLWHHVCDSQLHYLFKSFDKYEELKVNWKCNLKLEE